MSGRSSQGALELHLGNWLRRNWRLFLGLALSALCFYLAVRNISWAAVKVTLSMARWGWVALALGVTVATFMRLKQRWLRASVLAMSGLVTLTIVTYYAEGRLGLLALLVLLVIMLNLLLSPALVEWKLGYGRRK